MYYMGQGNNRLPAPYELDSQTSNQYLAKGGRAHRHRGMSKAHLSRHEANILDHIQGGPEHGPEGIKVYSHLEELLKNPHIVRSIHHHARQHHAHGSIAHHPHLPYHYAEGDSIEHLREGGRFGDNEIAMIGPNTHRLFNQLAGHATRNPYTGHPEYFSIGPALSGLWKTVSGAASKIPGMISGAAKVASPALKNVASSAGNFLKNNSSQIKDIAGGVLQATQPLIQQKLNQKLGEDWGGMAGQLAGAAQNKFIGDRDPNSVWSQMGGAAGTAINKYSQGASPRQAAGYGINQFGEDLGGGIGQGLSGFGGSLASGQDYRTAAQQGGQDFYNSMGGSQGVRNAMRDIGNNFAQGGFGGAQQAARNQMNQYMQRALPPLPQPANQQFNSFDPYSQDYGYGQDAMYG
jgi:hypothetical protein